MRGLTDATPMMASECVTKSETIYREAVLGGRGLAPEPGGYGNTCQQLGRDRGATVALSQAERMAKPRHVISRPRDYLRPGQ